MSTEATETRTSTSRWRVEIDMRVAALVTGVFLVVFVSHLCSPIIRAGGDTSWSIHTALSVIRHGDTDLNEYADFVEGERLRFAVRVGDDLYNQWPEGTSLISIPLVFLIDRAFDLVLGLDLEQCLSVGFPGGIERFIASLYVALASVLIFAIARRDLGLVASLSVVFVFAFCTTAWSSASRALWSHTPSLVLLSLSLWMLVRAETHPRTLRWLGLVLGLAYVVRMTNAVPAVLISLFVLVHHRRQLIPFAVGALAVAVLHFGYLYETSGGLKTQYQLLNESVYARHEFWDYFPTALAGTLVSPARGLFVFSPILLASLVGMAVALGRRPFQWLDVYLIAAVVLHWVTISTYPLWWAGWSYGPRVFTDMLPILVYFLVPLFRALPSLPVILRWLAVAVLSALAAVSFAIHFRGVTSWDAFWWDGLPESINDTTERLWDWENPPYLFEGTPPNLLWRSEQRYVYSLAPHQRRDVTHWLQRAERHLVNEQWVEARRVAEIARDIDPMNGLTHSVLAVANLRLNDRDAAIPSLIIATAHYSEDNLDELLEMAREELAAEEISLAEALFEGRASPWHCHRVAEWLARQDEHEEAIEIWDTALRIGPPHPEHLFGQYRSFLDLELYEECERVARRAIAVDSDHGWGHLYLGNALEHQDRIDEARAAWEAAVRTSTDGGSHDVAQANLLRRAPRERSSP